MKIIQLVSNALGKVLEVFTAYLLVQMLVLMSVQLLARHFPIITGVFWAEELARFSMITVIFFGAAISCKNKDHIAASIMEELLKGKARIIIKLVVCMLSAAFLFVVIRYGFEILPVISLQVSANMQVPMNFVYIVIPIGACVMLFYVLLQMLELVLELVGYKQPVDKEVK